MHKKKTKETPTKSLEKIHLESLDEYSKLWRTIRRHCVFFWQISGEIPREIRGLAPRRICLVFFGNSWGMVVVFLEVVVEKMSFIGHYSFTKQLSSWLEKHIQISYTRRIVKPFTCGRTSTRRVKICKSWEISHPEEIFKNPLRKSFRFCFYSLAFVKIEEDSVRFFGVPQKHL